MADLKTLASDAEALVRATAEDTTEKAKAARDRLKATIEKAKSTYDDLQARSLESARAAARRADETVRAHPYESIATAFGFGLLVGALLRRR